MILTTVKCDGCDLTCNAQSEADLRRLGWYAIAMADRMMHFHDLACFEACRSQHEDSIRQSLNVVMAKSVNETVSARLHSEIAGLQRMAKATKDPAVLASLASQIDALRTKLAPYE